MNGMTLDVKKKFSVHSDRVKSIDQHPSEPWILVSLYGGQVHIYNYQTETTLKQIEVTELPVRSAKFIARKQWVVVGADDMNLRTYNYNTTELVKKWEAHTDYIRCVAVHPTLPYILSSSDDMLIKLWDWEKNFQCVRVFEGHTHYVMKVVFNPKDPNTFASASLDRTIKVWGITSTQPHFTLEGRESHEKGVNSIEYYSGGDKPYLVSASDDRTIKVWDYQTKSCVQTLEGHTANVSAVSYHPELPIIISASEDGSVRLWNANTYRLEKKLAYGLDRAWCIACRPGSNGVAVGFDDGTILLKMGREIPAASMDQTGKIILAKQNEILLANVRSALEGGEKEPKDGESLPLAKKEQGHSEVYPQAIEHSPNGRLCAVCGDGEFTIYEAIAWRNMAYGNALEFVWGRGKGQYAVREHSSRIKIFNEFQQSLEFRTDFHAEGLFGGVLIGVRSDEYVCFYDWTHGYLIQQIDVVPKDIYWSESGDNVVIACENSFYMLKFNKALVNAALDAGGSIPEDGIADAFDAEIHEIPERVRTGKWVGDCFIYTNTSNKLNYCVGNLVETVSHLDRHMYLLGYLPRYNRVFLMDKSLGVLSYTLHLSVINYQTAVLRRDFATAEKTLPKIPDQDRTRIAHFLESQGHKRVALQVSNDLDHKFELAIQLGELKIASDIAQIDSESSSSDHKWKQLSSLALSKWDFQLAEHAMWKSGDVNGLLLLYTSTGQAKGLEKLSLFAQEKGRHNVAFVCLFLLHKISSCLDLLIRAGRFPEAAFMARSYAPSEVSRIVSLWRADLAKSNATIAKSLADPAEYPNLFPQHVAAVEAQNKFVPKLELDLESLPEAKHYLDKLKELNRDFIAELHQLLQAEQQPPTPAQTNEEKVTQQAPPTTTTPTTTPTTEN
eukprot:TRINITY_DN2331_c0_g1_i1.p1 TRINITY_DN2331_c0_g1~~TRINITY_DN2331_c0_g1_i1.p1  ORF type:complete len:896 (+),score=185.86 TRINITY_DN2331_c0_g1_i1:92-2779(+)